VLRAASCITPTKNHDHIDKKIEVRTPNIPIDDTDIPAWAANHTELTHRMRTGARD
jgi:hypothetical protein